MQHSLLRACAELNWHNTWPLDLDALLAKEGIRRCYQSASGRAGAAYLEVHPQPVITLIKDGDGAGEDKLSPRDRFSVAHELAHWVLWKKHAIPPAESTSDYWRQEALCDQFAQRLLMPPETLKNYLLSECAELPPVAFPHAVARTAHVTWHAAACAISSLSLFELAYVRLKPVIETSESLHDCSPKPTQKCSPTSNPTDHELSIFKVDYSSLRFGSTTFAGQQAHIQDSALSEKLTLIREVMKRGAGSVYRMLLTVSFGSVRLREVPSLVMAQGKSWVICFLSSNPGVMTKTSAVKKEGAMSETAQPRIPAKELESTWCEKNGWFESLMPHKVYLRPVQKMAIEAIQRRSCVSEIEFMLMLAHGFAKVDLKHLTEIEANTAIRHLEQESTFPQKSRVSFVGRL